METQQRADVLHAQGADTAFGGPALATPEKTSRGGAQF